MGTILLDRTKRRETLRLALIAAIAALAIVISTTTTADAAVVSKQWLSKLGSAGANGTATAKVFTAGTGSLAIALKRMARSTTYSETVYRGTCAKRTTRLFALPNFRTSSTGTINRTNNLTVSQARALSVAPFVVRFVAGSRVLCGSFAAVRLAVAPTPTPTASPSASPSASPTASPSATPVPPPTVAGSVPVGAFAQAITADASGIYVTNWWDGTISKIDPATGAASTLSSVLIVGPAGPHAITSGDGALWYTVTALDTTGSWTPGAAQRIDPASGVAGPMVPVGRFSVGVAAGLGAAWVVNQNDGTITRIDAATNTPTTFPIVGEPSAVTTGFGSVWVICSCGSVQRLDPASGAVQAAIPTGPFGADIEVADGFVWVSNPGHRGMPDGAVTKIDPATNRVVSTTVVGSGPWGLAAAGGFLWVGMIAEPTVVQISTATGAIANRVPVTAIVTDIAARDRSAWALHTPIPPEGQPPAPGSVTRINF